MIKAATTEFGETIINENAINRGTESISNVKREGQTGLGASKRDQHVKQEEAEGIITFKVVRNDK